MPHIGVFDSGVGGLTVLNELAKINPSHTFVYFGDTARCPYGGKSQETIVRYAKENSRFLIGKRVDCVVVACNTATALALEQLKNTFFVPIVGVIEPAAKHASSATVNNRIGVIGTRATIGSHVYQKELAKYKEGLTIFAEPCPLFVPIVEEFFTTPSIIRAIVSEYLTPFKDKDIDTLVLGCTHYPLLKNYIQEAIGNQVAIIDPALACAKEVSLMSLGASQPSCERFEFCVSDDPERFLRVGKDFFGFPIHKVDTVEK